jgi:hypothetical protein
MEDYIKNFDHYPKKIVYNFILGRGGIGDCVKYFMYALILCIKYEYRLYYKINNLPIEKYIKLKYPKMYIKTEDISNVRDVGENDFPYITEEDFNFVHPLVFFSNYRDKWIDINIQDVFEFSAEVLQNSHNLLKENITNYISIHLRMGDKFLECDKNYIRCPTDARHYLENRIFNCIEQNKDKNIIFFCDNNSYKLKIKSKYNNVFITDCDIGHTNHFNTTDKQTLDTITDIFLMAHSEKIYYASSSGFSAVAAKFKNIPLIDITPGSQS